MVIVWKNVVAKVPSQPCSCGFSVLIYMTVYNINNMSFTPFLVLNSKFIFVFLTFGVAILLKLIVGDT